MTSKRPHDVIPTIDPTIDVSDTEPDPPKADRRYERIYALARTVPAGEVATYGQIAFVAELSTPRMVGYAMAALPAARDGIEPVPWHRIINSQGRISERHHRGTAEGPDPLQRRLLIAEGVLFNSSRRVNFSQVGWSGPDWEWLETNGYDVGALIARSAQLKRTGPWSRWDI